MRKIQLLLFPIFLCATLSAQSMISFFGEVGYNAGFMHSKQLPIFYNGYNTYFQNSGLSKKFDTGKAIGMMNGEFYDFGIGIGTDSKFIIGLQGFLLKSKPNQVRFTVNDGRDISVGMRMTNVEIGYRISSSDKLFFQLHANLGFGTYSVYSAYVCPDGSKSFGSEHVMNGIYSDFTGEAGGGFEFGFKLLPCTYLVFHCDYYKSLVSKKNGQYHDFQDLYLTKSNITENYLPVDYSAYLNQSLQGSENSIYNDIKGFKLSVGLQFKTK